MDHHDSFLEARKTRQSTEILEEKVSHPHHGPKKKLSHQHHSSHKSHKHDDHHHDHHSRHSKSSMNSHNTDKEIMQGFKLDIEVIDKMVKLRQKAHLAFMSGLEREYYPEHPGHHRFALAFQQAKADPSLPNPKFYTDPFEDKLKNKPISKKGYGMGGLSAPRFAKERGLNVPAPNQYQKQVKEVLTKQHRFPPMVWTNYGLLGPNDKIWDEKVSRKLFTLWGKCHQLSVGFGCSTKQPRFGKTPKWNLVGPGNYPIRQLSTPPPRVFNSFLRGPAALNPATKVHCSYGPKQHCLECDVELMGGRDYYRSRLRVDPTPLRPIVESTDDQILMAMTEAEKQKKMKDEEENKRGKPKRVLLCRECYCKALRGESRFWKTRAEVFWLFEKTRHCGFIHEHNGIPHYTLKASCHWTRRLARKEACMTKHYPDKCEKRVVEKKGKFQA